MTKILLEVDVGVIDAEKPVATKEVLFFCIADVADACTTCIIWPGI